MLLRAKQGASARLDWSLNRREVLTIFNFALQVKQKTMYVLLSPLLPVETLKHSPGGIFLCAILEVGNLTLANVLELFVVLDLFCVVDELKVSIEIITKGIEDAGFHDVIFGDPRPQKARREETRSLLRKVATPREVFLMTLKSGLQRGGIHLAVRVIMKQGLHIKGDEMAAG